MNFNHFRGPLATTRVRKFKWPNKKNNESRGGRDKERRKERKEPRKKQRIKKKKERKKQINKETKKR